MNLLNFPLLTVCCGLSPFTTQLPARLKKCVEMGKHLLAVRYYSRAAGVLEQYATVESFKGINGECSTIISGLREILEATVEDPNTTVQDRVEAYALLLSLKVESEKLCESMLGFARRQFAADMENLRRQTADYIVPETSVVQESEGSGDGDSFTLSPSTDATEKISLAVSNDDGEAAVSVFEDPEDDEDDSDFLVKPRALSPEELTDEEEEEEEGEDREALLGNCPQPGESSRVASPVALPPAPRQFLFHLSEGDAVVLSNLTEWLMSYIETFIKPAETAGIDCKTSAEVEHLAEVKKIATARLVAFLDDTLGGYLAEVGGALVTATGSESVPHVVDGISIFFRGITRLHALFPHTDLATNATEICVEAARGLCNAVSRRLCESFDARLSAAAKCACEVGVTGVELLKLSTGLGRGFEQCARDAVVELNTLLETELAASGHEYFRKEFQEVSIKQDLALGLVRHTIAHLETIAGTSIRSPQDNPLSLVETPVLPKTSMQPMGIGSQYNLLLLAHFGRRLEERSVPEVVKMAVRLCPLPEDASVNGRVSSPGTTSASTPAQDDIRQQRFAANRVVALLLNRFVSDEGYAIADTLTPTVVNGGLQPPRAVRPAVRTAVSAVAASAKVASVVLDGVEDSSDITTVGDAGRGVKRREAYLRGRITTTGGADSGILTSIQSLFSEKVEVFSSTGFDRSDVMFGIVKLVLRSYVEDVRLQTFDAAGQQQIEVDAHYLGMQFWSHIDERHESYVNTLLQQVIFSLAMSVLYVNDALTSLTPVIAHVI